MNIHDFNIENYNIMNIDYKNDIILFYVNQLNINKIIIIYKNQFYDIKNSIIDENKISNYITINNIQIKNILKINFFKENKIIIFSENNSFSIINNYLGDNIIENTYNLENDLIIVTAYTINDNIIGLLYYNNIFKIINVDNELKISLIFNFKLNEILNNISLSGKNILKILNTNKILLQNIDNNKTFYITKEYLFNLNINKLLCINKLEPYIIKNIIKQMVSKNKIKNIENDSLILEDYIDNLDDMKNIINNRFVVHEDYLLITHQIYSKILLLIDIKRDILITKVLFSYNIKKIFHLENELFLISNDMCKLIIIQLQIINKNVDIKVLNEINDLEYNLVNIIYINSNIIILVLENNKYYLLELNS